MNQRKHPGRCRGVSFFEALIDQQDRRRFHAAASAAPLTAMITVAGSGTV
jgi:hypothetical protein